MDSNRLKLEIQKIEEIEQVDIQQVIEVGHIIENIQDIWTIANLSEKDRLCDLLFATIYTENSDIIAVEPKPTLWQLLKVGRENGEDRERNRISYPLILIPRTNILTLRKVRNKSAK